MKHILLFLTLPFFTHCTQSRSNISTGYEGKKLPSFSILLMDSSTKFNTNRIPEGEPFVLFYFSPSCPYCKAQTNELLSNIKTMKTIRFYFISDFPFASIKKYNDYYKLYNYPNIIIGQDNESYFSNYYKAPGVPYFAIYKKDKSLKQVLLGKVGTNLIKDITFE